MASFTLQRASWVLQISRTPKLFAVSFTTALPHRSKSRHLPRDLIQPLQPYPKSSQSSRHRVFDTSAQHKKSRRAYTESKVYRAQQAAQTQPSTRSSPLDAQPPQAVQDLSADNRDLSAGLNDASIVLDEGSRQVDWGRSFHGLSTEAFSPEAAKILLAPLDPDDIEIKPDGIIYLPEIKYRRILNQAFGPGGWGLAPRGETIVTAKAVTREYALVALGR